MELKEFSEKDYTVLYDLMYPIWHDTYKNIISKQQIDTLLQKYFSKDAIEHYKSIGYQYFNIFCENALCGITVIYEKENEIYLDKLYLFRQFRGKGIADFVFKKLLERGKDITLNVNQANLRALRCYTKNGFETESEEIIDLGNGMKNIDYKMRKKHTR